MRLRGRRIVSRLMVGVGPGPERWRMTIEETNKIDIISAFPGGGVVYLSVVDHLPWSDPQGGAISVEEHLYLLQEKLNAYLEYVDSGALAQDVPDAATKKVVFLYHHKYPIPPGAQEVIGKMRVFLEEHGIGFSLVHGGAEKIPKDDAV